MKYKDFKVMTMEEMKQITGGDAPNETHCGTCTNMNGTSLERSNVVCTSRPAGTICTDGEGVYGNAMYCVTPSGTYTEYECPHLS